MMADDLAQRQRQFRLAYAEHRASEGRMHDAAELARLPYLTSGPLGRQWRVRARSFDALVHHVLEPAATRHRRALSILDLGAGCGWLCYRTALAGHAPVALDTRDDGVDGLGAAAHYLQRRPGRFERVVASFDALPLASRSFDVAVFNASIHYALDLSGVLHEAARIVRPGGQIAVLDSPFYRTEREGAAMVEEKHRDARARFGDRSGALLALPFVEFLTPARIAAAGAGVGLVWRRHRVRYPAPYEARAVVAWLRGRRTPSRFDLWECRVP